jgi:hypothetical protein
MKKSVDGNDLTYITEVDDAEEALLEANKTDNLERGV